MNKWIIAGLLLTFASVSVAGQDLSEYRGEAAAASKRLMEDLSAELMREMQAGGPPEAIAVCSEAAPRIAGELSRQHGWKVTRVGTRVRNPLLGMPDAWEQEVLAQFSQRMEDGETLADMDHAVIITEPDGRYFRYMRAIGVREPCLVCHGPDAAIPEAVRSMLSENYPRDEAVGYQVGDLRGAVSVKRPLKD